MGGSISKGPAKADDPIYKDQSWLVTSLHRPPNLVGKQWGKPMPNETPSPSAPRPDHGDEDEGRR